MHDQSECTTPYIDRGTETRPSSIIWIRSDLIETYLAWCRRRLGSGRRGSKLLGRLVGGGGGVGKLAGGRNTEH